MSESPHLMVEEPVVVVSSAKQDILTAAKSGGIVFFGEMFAYASRFVFGIIVARSLGAAGYGLYDLGVTVALTLTYAALLGLPEGIVRFLSIAHGERDEASIWGILQTSGALAGSASLALALAVVGLADVLAQNLFHAPDLAPVLRIMSLGIPLTTLGRILIAAAQGFKEMRYQVYADSILFNVGKIGLTILLLRMGAGAPGAAAAYIIALAAEDALLL